MALLDDLDRRREQVQITRENSARLAQAYATVVSEGQGTLQHPDRIAFNTLFIEKPFVSHAGETDIDDLADMLDVDPESVPLPHISGFVTTWDQDERDLYIGCWVAVRVNFPFEDFVDPTLMPVVTHHFTFAAIAMKDIPLDGDDAVTD